MITVIMRYLILFVITLSVLISFSLALAHMFPGDPLTNLSGVTPANQEVYARLGSKWAIDANPLYYFINYCSLLLQGDWGISSISGNQLISDMARVIPATIELSIYSAFIAIFIGVPLGCIAGIKAYTKVDYSINCLLYTSPSPRD